MLWQLEIVKQFNVALKLRAVLAKYDQYLRSERHVRGDVSVWAHFLCSAFTWAFGRALRECMKGSALFLCIGITQQRFRIEWVATMQIKTQEYFPQIDLAKIIAIFLVIVLHVNGAITISGDILLFLDWTRTLITSVSYSCIDLFALATGFLCIYSSCRYSRILILWIAALFWGLTVLFTCQCVFDIAIPWEFYCSAAFPVLRSQYWFFSAYFMLFLCMPLLNKGVLGLTQVEHKRLMAALLVFVCFYSCTGIDRDPFRIHKGFSFVWLAVVYVFGAYIRIHWHKPLCAKWCFVGALAVSFLCSMRQLLSIFVGFRIPGDRFALISYVSPLTFLVSVLIFLGCLNLHITKEKTCRILKSMSACTFGIYLIHVQPFVWKYVWPVQWQKVEVAGVAKLLMVVGCGSVVLFVAFGMIEWIRLKVFEVIGVNRLVARVDRILPR